MNTRNEEAKEVIETLPEYTEHSQLWYKLGHPNAYVYKDSLGGGRVCILLSEGGWLGADFKDVEGDVAPFAG